MARKVHRRVRRIGVATTDWSGSIPSPSGGMAMGGAGWVRFGQLARVTKHHMVIGRLVVGDGRLGVVGWDRQTYFDCDVVFVQRYMDDWVPDAITRARANGQVVVNDIDDWFWGLHPDNAAAAVTDPSKNKRSNTDHYKQCIQASTAVTVSTPWLANRLGPWGVPVRLIQNRVTCTDFAPRVHRPVPPVVGWTGSTAHRSGDLDVLAGFSDRLGPSQLWHHTGHHPAHPQFAKMAAIDPGSVSTLPMLPPWEYPSGFVFDIGVVPLVDVAFNHAKSFIKGIEYAAAGVPFVASPLPEYQRLHDQYGIGRLAASPDEWVGNLRELADKPARVAEASRQRAAVLDTLDVRFQAAELDELVGELCA